MKAFVGYGCKVFKTSSMTSHSKSRRHIEALELKKIQAHSNIEKAAHCPGVKAYSGADYTHATRV